MIVAIMMVFTVLPITAGTASMRVSMRMVAASSTRSRSSSPCKKKLLLLLVVVMVVVVVVVVKRKLVELLKRVGLGWVEDLTLHQLDIVTKSLQEYWLHCIRCKSQKYLMFEHSSPS